MPTHAMYYRPTTINVNDTLKKSSVDPSTYNVMWNRQLLPSEMWCAEGIYAPNSIFLLHYGSALVKIPTTVEQRVMGSDKLTIHETEYVNHHQNCGNLNNGNYTYKTARDYQYDIMNLSAEFSKKFHERPMPFLYPGSWIWGTTTAEQHWEKCDESTDLIKGTTLVMRVSGFDRVRVKLTAIDLKLFHMIKQRYTKSKPCRINWTDNEKPEEYEDSKPSGDDDMKELSSYDTLHTEKHDQALYEIRKKSFELHNLFLQLQQLLFRMRYIAIQDMVARTDAGNKDLYDKASQTHEIQTRAIQEVLNEMTTLDTQIDKVLEESRAISSTNAANKDVQETMNYITLIFNGIQLDRPRKDQFQTKVNETFPPKPA